MAENERTAVLVQRHVRFGWWSLLIFLSLGIGLEALHGLKVGWYLHVANEARRLMMTLAHTHGTLLAIVHLAFAFTASIVPRVASGRSRHASPLLCAASFLLPGGFLLGGIVIYGGDPGLGVLLVPVGAICLFAAVLLTALAVTTAAPQPTMLGASTGADEAQPKKKRERRTAGKAS